MEACTKRYLKDQDGNVDVKAELRQLFDVFITADTPETRKDAEQRLSKAQKQHPKEAKALCDEMFNANSKDLAVFGMAFRVLQDTKKSLQVPGKRKLLILSPSWEDSKGKDQVRAYGIF